jgi:hypothetical protein
LRGDAATTERGTVAPANVMTRNSMTGGWSVESSGTNPY